MNAPPYNARERGVHGPLHARSSQICGGSKQQLGSKGGGPVGKKRLFWGTAAARLYHMMWEDRKKGAVLIMVKTSDRALTTCEKRMRHPGWKMYCLTSKKGFGAAFDLAAMSDLRSGV